MPSLTNVLSDRKGSNANSIFGLYEAPTPTTNGVVIASGKITADSLATAPPSITPGDRLEIDEMSDNSLIWQVVRNLRRNSTISVMSDLNGLSGFHSRNSSQDTQDSGIIPSSFNRSRLQASFNQNSVSEKMKLVVSKNKHQRMLSSEKGVGNLGYIKSPTLSSAAFDDAPVQRRPSTSSDRSLQIYEADDNVVSALIEDVSHLSRTQVR